MSALADFVNEQKKKEASVGSFSDLRSKVSSSVSGLFGRGGGGDEEILIESPTSSASGQLPSSRNRRLAGWFASEDSLFGLSRTQRMLAFFISLLAGLFCFAMAALLLPVLVLQARKFAALNTMGSLLLMSSFAFLWGPMSYMRHLLSRDRCVVTAAYLTSVLATLYSALWLQSTIFTLICAVFQMFALIWFVLSYVPGGERGLRLISTLFGGVVRSQSKTVLPI